VESLILVAEDERNIREFLTLALEMFGFVVITAQNGEEAIEMARNHKPDLILMDVRMPKKTGYQAFEVLRATPDTKGIPIVFLSAYANTHEMRKWRAMGAEEYLAKPISPTVLSSQLTKILGKTRANKVN
jgi:CheY-like chemotaxis protein